MYAVLWCWPEDGTGAVPKLADGRPNCLLEWDMAEKAALAIFDAIDPGIVMIVEAGDLA